MSLDAYVHLQPVNEVWTLALAQVFCQGILFSQASTYCRQRKAVNDSKLHASFVLFCVALNGLQTALLVYKSWRVVAERERWIMDPLRTGELILNGICTTAVQAFFVRRCWKISRSRMLVLLLCATMLMVLGANIYLTIVVLSDLAFQFMEKASQNTQYANALVNRVSIAFGIYMGGSAGLDILITVTLLLFLWRSRTGVRKLDYTTILSIGQMTWETLALPMVAAVLACVLYFTGHLDYVLLFSGMTGKLYCHGLLRTLNARLALGRRIVQEELHMQPWLLTTPPQMGVAKMPSTSAAYDMEFGDGPSNGRTSAISARPSGAT
ncbi:hypothetical protein BKA62DRAFT_400528 [Auriculariales sp. MPI-PUGE-AT-0066]|nr:hypothetical protein BKA62DRAFT_400528 [Auriculariales sp. MPI-PUGE-AT-0066]